MTDDPVLARVRDIVVEIAGPARAPDGVGADTRLGEGGVWLDSLDLFEVILACEEAFGVAVDADVTVEALRTVGSLADLMRAVQAATTHRPRPCPADDPG